MANKYQKDLIIEHKKTFNTEYWERSGKENEFIKIFKDNGDVCSYNVGENGYFKFDGRTIKRKSDNKLIELGL